MQRALDACHTRGIPAAISQALRPHDYAPFVSAGGTLVQELFLLVLHDPPPQTRWTNAASTDPRRHRADHRIARLDYLAFGGFWHFDTIALADALAATRVSRLRAIVIDDEPVGYIISGHNGERGFIQRLAVHPAHQGRGYASALLRDSLGWLGRRGATSVTINTQTDNHRARTLYERHGFSVQPERLGVIGWNVSLATAPFMPWSRRSARSSLPLLGRSDSLRSDNPDSTVETPSLPFMPLTPRSVATAPSLSDSLRSDNPDSAVGSSETLFMPRSVATAPTLSDSLRSDNPDSAVGSSDSATAP
jgi:ribosomal protein S18 acetylase RimI-like enzyme